QLRPEDHPMTSLLYRPARVRAASATLALSIAALTLHASVAAAQQPTPPGVSIGLEYNTGTKPGVLVLPVTGASGDSIRAILMRDFDYSDRMTVIGNPERPDESPVVAGAATNYP